MLITLTIAATSLCLGRSIVRANYLKDSMIDTGNGINESFTLTIGGINQYFNVRGEDKSNPLVLVLHGGPGSSVIPIMHLYQSYWESFSTVINWDQRNTGKTYYLNNPESVYETLTLDQMIQDIYEVVEAMKIIYNQENLIIVGHSWGSLIGTVYAQTYPETIKGYIGIGQMINAAEGDRLAVEQAMIKAQALIATKDVETLSGLTDYSLEDTDFQMDSFKTMRKLTSKYLAPDAKNVSLWQILTSPYYTLKDSRFFLLNGQIIQKPLLDIIAFDFDARDYNEDYKTPVYYICGEQDWYTPTALVEDYYDNLNAPQKGIFVIEKAGHLMMLDQPEEFAYVLQAIIDEIL